MAAARRVHWLPIVTFTAVTIAFLLFPLLGLRTFAAVDLNELGAPYRSAIGRAPQIVSAIQTDQVEAFPFIVEFTDDLREGHWQRWEPNVAAGAPTGILPSWLMASPFNVPFLLLPAWYAVGLKVALQLLFGQTFMYLFLRRLNVGVAAATVGAVAFVFAGVNIVLLHRLTAEFVLPALLWALTHAVTRPRLWQVPVIAVFVAWSWLEGFPSGFLYCLYAAAGWAGFLLAASVLRTELPWRRAAAGLLRPVGVGIGGVAAGFGLAAFNLLPFVIEVSSRGLLETRDYAAGPFHLPVAQFLGVLDLEAAGASPLGELWSGPNMVESTTHVGSIALLAFVVGLAGAAVGRLRLASPALDAWRYFSVLAVVVSTIAFFGTPLGTAAYALPGLSTSPISRSRFLIPLGVAVVGALSLDAWLSSRSHGTAPKWSARVVLVWGSLLVGVAAIRWIEAADAADVGRSSVVASIPSLLWAVAAMVVVLVVVKRNVSDVVAAIALAGLLWMQLALPLRDFTPAAPVGDFYQEQQGHDTLRALLGDDYRFAASGIVNFYPNSAQVHDLADLRGVALHSESFRALMEAASPGAFSRDAFKVILPLQEWDLASPLFDHLALGVFALGTNERPFGLTSIVADVTAGAGDSTWGDVDASAGLVVRGARPGEPPSVDVAGGRWMAYDPGFLGGVDVGIGDVTGDDDPEIVTGPGPGGGGDIRVFDLAGTMLAQFDVFGAGHSGGASVAVGDIDGEGKDEILVGSGPGIGSRVVAFAADGSVVAEWSPYGEQVVSGLDLAGADLDGDGDDEVVTVPIAGSAHVRAFQGEGTVMSEFFAFAETKPALAVSAGDLNPGRDPAEIVVSGPASGQARIFDIAGTMLGEVSLTAGDRYGIVVEDGFGSLVSGGGTVVTTGAFEPVSWSTTTAFSDEAPQLAPGPITGLQVDVRSLGCDGSLVQVGIRSGDRELTSEIPGFDVAAGSTTWAVTGLGIAAGEEYSVFVASDPPCTLQVPVSELASGASVVARKLLVPEADAPVRLVATDQAWFYERPTAWPLVSAHGSWQLFGTQEEALEFVVGPGAEDTVAVVASGGPPSPGVVAEIDAVELGDERVTFSTTSSGPSLVVYSQNTDANWHARVDGEEIDIVRVDGALAGVFVEAGDHDVEFTYEPRHFSIGSRISLGTLGLLIALGTWGVMSARRERGSG